MSRRFLFALLALTTAVYARAIGFEFLSWDDRIFIQENPLLKMPFFEAMKAAFLNFFFGDYLPLTQISLWFDAVLTGAPHAGVSHAVNIALHLANIVLLYRFLKYEVDEKAWLNQDVAAFMLLFFALHPLQVESVAWVSERKGLLAAFFALLALVCFTRKSYAAYTLSFLASILSKTSNLALPLLVFAYDHWIQKTRLKTALLRQVPALLLAVTIGGLRIFAYSNLTTGMGDAFAESHRWLLLPIQMANAVGFYFGKMLWPLNLSPIYPLFRLEPIVAVHLVLLFVFAAFTWRARRQNPAAPLLFVFTLILLLPVLQIVPRLSYVNDRYFYMPLWAAAGLLVAALPVRPARFSLSAMAPLAFLLAFTSFNQLSFWRADLPFWTKAVQLRPDSGVAYLSLGQAYEKESDFTAAHAAYEKAAELGPEVRARALSNLSGLHAESSRPLLYDLTKAEAYLVQALESPDVRSEKPGLMYNLARLRFLQNRTTEAASICQEIIADIESRHDLRFESVKALARKCFQ